MHTGRSALLLGGEFWWCRGRQSLNDLAVVLSYSTKMHDPSDVVRRYHRHIHEIVRRRQDDDRRSVDQHGGWARPQRSMDHGVRSRPIDDHSRASIEARAQDARPAGNA